MRTLVVGLGNPILSDDSVGIKVARLVQDHLPPNGAVEVIEAHAGGLRLMEAMAGYERAIIVDAMKSGRYPVGAVHVFPLEAPDTTRNLLCAHDGDLSTALQCGRDLGVPIPESVVIIGIEADDVEQFGEGLTSRVQAALPHAVATVLQCCNAA